MLVFRMRFWVVLGAMGWGATGGLEARDWIKLEAEDFTLMSDARENLVVEFARDYAAQRHALRTVLSRPGVKVPRSIMILHDRRKDFLSYTAEESRERGIERFSTSVTVDGRSVTTLSIGGDRFRTFDVAMEFDTMWVLRRFGWSVPTWMSQGTGLVFATARVDRRSNEVVVGESKSGNRGLKTSLLIDWERFFAIGRNSDEYRGKKKHGVYHAQSWALMHWLLLRDHLGAKRFSDLAYGLREGSAADAVVEVGGANLKDLDRTLLRHIGSRPPTLRIAFDVEEATKGFVITPLPTAERLALMAEFAAAADKSALADRLYLQADQLDPDSPAVLEAGARWYLRRKDRAAAVQKYREAIERGSTNPQAYVFSADWRLDRAGGNIDRKGEGIPMVLEPAEAEARRALALDPGMGQAYVLLGRIAYLEPEPDARRLAELSARVGPDHWGTMARYYRALLLQRLGQEEKAIADLNLLIEHPEAMRSTQERARRQLVFFSMEDLQENVQALMQAKEYEAAQAAVAAWVEAHPSADATTEAGRLMAKISEVKIRQYQADFDRERKRLQSWLRQRHYERALRHIHRLQAETTVESLLNGYTKLARQIEGVALPKMIARLRAEQQWADVVDAAELFLEHQPANHRSRVEVEDALQEARLATSI